jgi:hypothetical protein
MVTLGLTPVSPAGFSHAVHDRKTSHLPPMTTARRMVAIHSTETAYDPAARVRLGCAFGSLYGLLFIFSDHYRDIPDDKLRQ